MRHFIATEPQSSVALNITVSTVDLPSKTCFTPNYV